MLNVKLGKKLGRIDDPRTFQLGSFMAPLARLDVPVQWRLASKRKTVPMFANDDYGDCTCASTGHRIIAEEAAVGQSREIQLTDDDVLAAYSAVTGFRRDDPSTDNGAYMLDIANFLRTTGIGREKDGTPHTVDGYVQVNHARLEQVRLGMLVFGGVWVGVWLPVSAQQQTGPVKTWDVPAQGPIGDGQPGSWGGHAIYAAGYDPSGVTVYTWGREQRMSWAFWRTYVDEAYAFISEDYLRVHAQTTPRGFDLQTLRSYLAELGR